MDCVEDFLDRQLAQAGLGGDGGKALEPGRRDLREPGLVGPPLILVDDDLDLAGVAQIADGVVLADGSEVIVPLGGLVDLTKECGKLRTELEQLEVQLASLSKRLRDEGFTGRAPANVVAAERTKEEEWIKRREQLAEKVKALCGG